MRFLFPTHYQVLAVVSEESAKLVLFPLVPDKAPSEAVFRGKEFLSYDLSQTGGEPIVSAQDSVTFYFKTRQPNGLLFYTGEW